MKKQIYSLTHKDQAIVDLVERSKHKILAAWAIDCVERVLPYYEEAFPEDQRPQEAIAVLRTWMNTGVFSMAVIRKAALDAHAAAREVDQDNAARSAARAAGQAVATAHVRTHAIAAANYALQALHRAASTFNAEDEVATERSWQYQRLLELQGN